MATTMKTAILLKRFNILLQNILRLFSKFICVSITKVILEIDRPSVMCTPVHSYLVEIYTRVRVRLVEFYAKIS